METIRAFIAIELPGELTEALRGVRDGLDKGLKGVAWVRPESIHLTLKFLGDIESPRVDEIGFALEKAASNIRPFTLSAEGVGGFPNFKTPRVLWVGIKESAPLALLQKNIDEGLDKIGFPKDGRPFSPHLTLCRVKSASDGRTLGRMAEALRPDINIDFRVDSFILFKSVLSPKGAVHTAVKHITLPGDGD